MYNNITMKQRTIKLAYTEKPKYDRHYIFSTIFIKAKSQILSTNIKIFYMIISFKIFL